MLGESEPQRPQPGCLFKEVEWVLVNSGDKFSWKEVRRSRRAYNALNERGQEENCSSLFSFKLRLV